MATSRILIVLAWFASVESLLLLKQKGFSRKLKFHLTGGAGQSFGAYFLRSGATGEVVQESALQCGTLIAQL